MLDDLKTMKRVVGGCFGDNIQDNGKLNQLGSEEQTATTGKSFGRHVGHFPFWTQRPTYGIIYDPEFCINGLKKNRMRGLAF